MAESVLQSILASMTHASRTCVNKRPTFVLHLHICLHFLFLEPLTLEEYSEFSAVTFLTFGFVIFFIPRHLSACFL